MGYQYALHHQGRCLLQERQEIKARHASASATSRALRAERNNASYTKNERHHRRVSRVDNMDYNERSILARNLESSFISIDERGNIILKTPEAALVAVQTYLLTTQPTLDDPRAGMHRAAL
jgi:hypothetical protein